LEALSFLGQAVVEQALAQGHDITLFNRGQINTALFPEIEQIHGDRDGGLDALDDPSIEEITGESYGPLKALCEKEVSAPFGDRTIAKGLTFRPLEDTVQATMDWSLSRAEDYEWRGGLRPEREAELLDAWLRRS